MCATRKTRMMTEVSLNMLDPIVHHKVPFLTLCFTQNRLITIDRRSFLEFTWNFVILLATKPTKSINTHYSWYQKIPYDVPFNKSRHFNMFEVL